MIYNIKDNNEWQITCSKFEIMSKICNLFDKFIDFDWTNVIMAGPLLNAIILKKYGIDYDAGIDLFISNKKDFCTIFEYFKVNLKIVYSFSSYKNMITILSPNFCKPINLFGLFDKSCSPSFGLFFDGDNCIATNEYINNCEKGHILLPPRNLQYIPSKHENPLYVLAKIKYHYNKSYIIENNDLSKAMSFVFGSI